MKPIYNSKEFLSLEPEDKLKILEIEKQKFEGDDLTEELNNLKMEESQIMSEIAEIKEKLLDKISDNLEQNTIDAKLTLINAEIEELKKRSGEIKQKSIDLEKNKNALELKNSISKKNSLSSEIEELKAEIESLHEQKIESQNSLVEIRANYDNFYNSYNEEIARLLFENSKLSAVTTSEKSEDFTLEKFKIDELIKSKDEEKIKLLEEITRLTEKCLAIEEDIQEKQDQIAEVVLPEESKELIVQAKDLECEIIIYDEMLKRVGKLLDDNKQELLSSKEKYSSELQAERKIEEDLRKIDESTAKVFENSDLSNFEKLRSCDKTLKDIDLVELEIKKVDNQIQQIKDRSAKRLEKIELLKNEQEKQEEIYNTKAVSLKELKKDLEKLQETREELLGSNCLGMITQYTNIGDFCPVCRTRVTQKNHMEVMDLTGIEREIEMAKSKIGYAEKDLNNQLSNIASIKAIISYEQSMIDTDGQEVMILESSKPKIYQRVVDVNDKMLDNFTSLKNALTKTSVALENIITLQNRLQETVKDNTAKKIEFGTRISLLSELDEELIDLYYVLQKERAERELLLLEAKSSMADDFDEKRTTLTMRESQQTELTKNLIDLCMQVSDLKAKIFAAQESLCVVEHELGKLEAQKIMYSSVSLNDKSDEIIYEDYNCEYIMGKIEELKSTHRHLLSLKQDAENSLQNIIKEYDVKTKLLNFKISEHQDTSALVSALMYRYNFKDENEVREYIVTDGMLKLKESELKSYNNMLQKLEVQREYLTQNNSAEISFDEYTKLTMQRDELQSRLGEIKVRIEDKEKEVNEFNQILQLLENYK